MRVALSPARRRALAVAILALAVGLSVAATAWPIWSAHRYYDETIDRMRLRLAQLQRAAALGAGLEQHYQQLRRTQSRTGQYLESESVALAAAELQRVVKSVATARRAEVLSTQIVPAAYEESFTRVALKVRMRATLEALVQVFHALETGEPLLFLDDVSIRGRGGVHGRLALTTPEEVLDVDFQLVGYMRNST